MAILYRSVLLLVLVGCLQAKAVLASCGTAECPLDLSSFDALAPATPHWTSRFSLRPAWEYIVQDQPRFGSEAVAFRQVARPDHDEIETTNRNLRLLAAFDLTPRWHLQLGVPLLNRSHRHVAVAGHSHEGDSHDHGDGAAESTYWNFTRLGDISLWARHAWLSPTAQRRSWLRVGLGLSAPSGSTKVRNDAGALAEPTLQPGRGAWGVMLEAEVGWQPLGQGGGRLFASGFYRYNFAGWRQYRFGDEVLVHLGGQYPLWRRLNFLVQLSGQVRARDEAGRSGELSDATGGRAIYLSPGGELALLDGLSLYAYYQLPLYQYVNQVQLSAERNLLVGLNYRINIFDN